MSFSGSLKKIVIIVAVISVILGCVYWIYLTYFSLPPWLFKGAYAKYYGEAKFLFMTVKITHRIEVLDFNRTHCKLLSYSKIDTPLGIQENQSVEWHRFDSPLEGVVREYESTIYIDALEITRECTVREFFDGSVYYYDKKTGWVLKMKYIYDSYSIDLNLIETNIPL